MSQLARFEDAVCTEKQRVGRLSKGALLNGASGLAGPAPLEKTVHRRAEAVLCVLYVTVYRSVFLEASFFFLFFFPLF